MPNKFKIFILVGLLATGLDQITKHIVLLNFQLGEALPVVDGFFNFTYLRNPGAAFGFLAQIDPSLRSPFFLMVPVFALILLTVMCSKLSNDDFKGAFALSLIAGGAMGNWIDRIQYGWVVDFIDFHHKSFGHYPAFNLADSFICIGVVLLLVESMSLRNKSRDLPMSPRHSK